MTMKKSYSRLALVAASSFALAAPAANAAVIFEADFESGLTADTGTITYTAGNNAVVLLQPRTLH